MIMTFSNSFHTLTGNHFLTLGSSEANTRIEVIQISLKMSQWVRNLKCFVCHIYFVVGFEILPIADFQRSKEIIMMNVWIVILFSLFQCI